MKLSICVERPASPDPYSGDVYPRRLFTAESDAAGLSEASRLVGAVLSVRAAGTFVHPAHGALVAGRAIAGMSPHAAARALAAVEAIALEAGA